MLAVNFVLQHNLIKRNFADLRNYLPQKLKLGPDIMIPGSASIARSNADSLREDCLAEICANWKADP